MGLNHDDPLESSEKILGKRIYSEMQKRHRFSEEKKALLKIEAEVSKRKIEEGFLKEVNDNLDAALTRKQTNLSSHDRRFTFDNINIEGINPDALRQVEGWTPGDGPFLLMGSVGKCKTHLLKALALKHYTVTKSFFFLEATELMDFVAQDNFKYKRKNLNILCSNYALLVDDLGRLKGRDFEKNILLDILNDRILKERPLFISSDDDEKVIKEKFGIRFVDRLLEAKVQIIDFGNNRKDSYRRKLYRENLSIIKR